MSKAIKQPVAGLTLLAMMALGFPTPSQAQVNSPQSPVPAALPVPAPNNQAPPVPNQAPVAPAPGVAPAPTGPVPATPQTNQPGQAPGINQSGQGAVDYMLGGGDRIRINVFEVPEYTGDYQIPPGGDLFLPLVGSVSLLGLTQAEAADAIATKYARYLKRPLVTVSLIAPRPINVVIAGEVNSPGSYTVGLQGGAGNDPGVQYPTIVSALTLAQGVTLAGDLRRVELRRRAGLGQQQKISTIDLTELAKTGNTLVRDITLRDGDTIYVPTADKVSMAEIRQYATASFAAAPNRPRSITVVGEVNRPGSYVIVGGSTSASAPTSPGNNRGGGTTIIQADGGAGGGLPTVSRAIQLAGGITSSADVRRIQIRRPTKDGREQRITANFWRLLQGDPNQDTIVQEGDTVIVPTSTDINPAEATALADASFSPATIQVSVVGEVKNPGVVNLQPNTPLNQAILTAGGFDNARAKRGSVDLIRLNPDGTVTKQRLQLDFSKGIAANNPILRNNDIVVVSRNTQAGIGDALGAVFGPILSPVLGLIGIFR